MLLLSVCRSRSETLEVGLCLCVPDGELWPPRAAGDQPWGLPHPEEGGAVGEHVAVTAAEQHRRQPTKDLERPLAPRHTTAKAASGPECIASCLCYSMYEPVVPVYLLTREEERCCLKLNKWLSGCLDWVLNVLTDSQFSDSGELPLSFQCLCYWCLSPTSAPKTGREIHHSRRDPTCSFTAAGSIQGPHRRWNAEIFR